MRSEALSRLARQLDEAWRGAERELPPDFHLVQVRTEYEGKSGHVAIAWFRGDDIEVYGDTPGEALTNLVMECVIRHRGSLNLP